MAFVVTLGLTAPIHAHAATFEAEPAAAAEPAEPLDPERQASLDRARDLHERAQTRFEMFDYEAAIEAWMEAYSLLRRDEQSREISNAIVWNIATANIKAYEVDKDVTHLHQGLLLLRKYMEEYVSIHGEQFETDVETYKIRKKVDELQGLIEAARSGQPAPKPAPDEASPGPAAPGKEKKDKKDKKVGTLSFVGIGALAVGAGGVALMAAGMVGAQTWRDRFEEFPADRGRITPEGERANTLAVTGAVAGGVFLATGVALLVADQVLRKKKKGPWDPGRGESKKRGAAALAPTISPGGGGYHWIVQF